MQNIETTENQRGLRLLALDDGGIRGLSELIILQEIMNRLKTVANEDFAPKPCDYFDVIGGVGTGGVIALMLGRLQMPVDVAIDKYVEFSKKVYSDMKMFGTEKFKTTTLVSGMKDLLKAAELPVDLLMLENNPSCHCFVLALPAANIGFSPRIFRSYKVTANQDYNCSVVEAACATSTAPQFFKPMIIGDGKISEEFIGASLGHSNPTIHVLQEAEQYKNLPGVFYRLNVQHGLQEIALDDWNSLGEVKTHSLSYLSGVEVTENVNSLVRALHQALKHTSLGDMSMYL
ncbi:hypothetical protein H0H92_011801 [Tricholoma furcatifolium]|nr:hypothetical protein H0H92_011801 [Tricholoma furcatifolium]